MHENSIDAIRNSAISLQSFQTSFSKSDGYNSSTMVPPVVITRQSASPSHQWSLYAFTGCLGDALCNVLCRRKHECLRKNAKILRRASLLEQAQEQAATGCLQHCPDALSTLIFY
jgi:hypothetical protein